MDDKQKQDDIYGYAESFSRLYCLVRDFKQGFANRTDSELILPGGKGINVSVVLKNLGMESTALSLRPDLQGRRFPKGLPLRRMLCGGESG